MFTHYLNQKGREGGQGRVRQPEVHLEAGMSKHYFLRLWEPRHARPSH